MLENLDPTVRNLVIGIIIVHIVALLTLCAYGLTRNRNYMEDTLKDLAKQKRE